MGSVHLSCFASGQTIAEGDPCVVIPIRQQATIELINVIAYDKPSQLYGAAHSAFHPGCYWLPVAGPIWTTYTDFGRGELIQSEANRTWLSALFDVLHHDGTITEPGEDEYHDHPFDFRRLVVNRGLTCPVIAQGASRQETPDKEFFRQSKIWWGELMRVMGKDRVFIRAPATNSPRPLTFSVLHGDAVSQLVQLASEKSDGRHQSMQPPAFFARALAMAHSRAQEMVKKGHPYEPTAAYVLRSQLELIADDLRYVPGAFPVVSEELGRITADSHDPEQLFPYFGTYLELGYLLRGLKIVGASFTPRTFAGEDFNNSTGRAFARFVAETSTKVCERRRHEEYENGDGYEPGPTP